MARFTPLFRIRMSIVYLIKLLGRVRMLSQPHSALPLSTDMQHTLPAQLPRVFSSTRSNAEQSGSPARRSFRMVFPTSLPSLRGTERSVEARVFS
jgi:hypothetical protein